MADNDKSAAKLNIRNPDEDFDEAKVQYYKKRYENLKNDQAQSDQRNQMNEEEIDINLELGENSQLPSEQNSQASLLKSNPSSTFFSNEKPTVSNERFKKTQCTIKN